MQVFQWGLLQSLNKVFDDHDLVYNYAITDSRPGSLSRPLCWLWSVWCQLVVDGQTVGDWLCFSHPVVKCQIQMGFEVCSDAEMCMICSAVASAGDGRKGGILMLAISGGQHNTTHTRSMLLLQLTHFSPAYVSPRVIFVCSSKRCVWYSDTVVQCGINYSWFSY